MSGLVIVLEGRGLGNAILQRVHGIDGSFYFVCFGTLTHSFPVVTSSSALKLQDTAR